MTREKRLQDILNQAFNPSFMMIENESHGHNVPKGSETHFKIVVVSKDFSGLSKIDRSRKVHATLHEELNTGLHALTQRLYSPEEWDKVKDTFEMTSPPCHGGSKN